MVGILQSLWNDGLLVTAWGGFRSLERRRGCEADCTCAISSVRTALWNMLEYVERRFDRRHGTDTAGVIPLSTFTIESRNIGDGHWYEPMSESIFRQLMEKLGIRYPDYEFVDFGSGKGRVLLLASEYGFKKIYGVEFVRELHDVAVKNVEIWEKRTRESSGIATVCMDAVEFSIPAVPVVLFFYSPFKGSVMKQVLDNIMRSASEHARDVLLVFYGSNPESITLLESTGLSARELTFRTDRTRISHYRGFAFRNVQSTDRSGQTAHNI